MREPVDLVLRAESLRARVQLDAGGRRTFRDPTGPAPLALEATEAPVRPSQRLVAPERPGHPPDGPGGPETANDAPIRPPGSFVVGPDGSRWALRCYCGRHPDYAHVAQALPPAELDAPPE